MSKFFRFGRSQKASPQALNVPGMVPQFDSNLEESEPSNLLFCPKGYVPKAGGGKAGLATPIPAAMVQCAVRYISPAKYVAATGDQVSPNVLSVELGSLSHTLPLATGDPVCCTKCQATFSEADAANLKPKPPAPSEGPEGGKMDAPSSTAKIWTCKFCGCTQDVEIEEAEIPKSSVTEYVIAPGSDLADPAAAATAATSTAAAVAPEDIDDSYVIFCVDVSGSMNVTQMGAGGRHVSKLACVASAVYTQIDTLRHEHPHRRVALITFGNDVDFFDGTEHRTVGGSAIATWESIVSQAETFKLDMPVTASFDGISENLMRLTDRGCTALGPALLAAITVASRKRGSYVVLCTDGMANQGIGSLEDVSADSAKDMEGRKSEVEMLYERLGQTAKDAGVAVSIIGIKGAQCRMENLGVVADATGGAVEMADASGIDFAAVMEEPLIATNVSVTMRVVPAFVFQNGASVQVADIGNSDTRTQHQCTLFSAPDEKIAPPSEIRVQCEVRFTTRNGAVHLRIAEKTIPFLLDTKRAVEGINVQLVGGYVARTAAKLAHDGDVENAGSLAQNYQDQLTSIVQSQEDVQEDVLVTQQQQMSMFSAQNSRAQTYVSNTRALPLRSRKAVNSSRTDEESADIYQMRQAKGAQQCLIM